MSDKGRKKRKGEIFNRFDYENQSIYFYNTYLFFEQKLLALLLM